MWYLYSQKTRKVMQKLFSTLGKIPFSTALMGLSTTSKIKVFYAENIKWQSLHTIQLHTVKNVSNLIQVNVHEYNIGAYSAYVSCNYRLVPTLRVHITASLH